MAKGELLCLLVYARVRPVKPGHLRYRGVEILRGPQGTFFGRNSEGGALNYRTRKPSEEFYGRIDFGIGQFNTYELSGVVNGKIAEGLSARLTVHTEKTDGPILNLHPSGGDSGADYVHIRGQLRYEPDAGTTIDAHVSHTIDNSGIQPKLSSCISQSAFGLPYNLASQALLGGIGCYDAKGEFSKWVAAGPGGTRAQLGGLPRSAFPDNRVLPVAS